MYSTEISDALLAIAMKDQFILDYWVENTKNMSFEDNSFDFVFLQRILSSFSKTFNRFIWNVTGREKGCNFNNDNFLVKIIRSIIYAFLLMLSGINKYEKFETVGNYIFTISERELNKIAIA